MRHTAPDVEREVQKAREERKWYYELIRSQEQLANQNPQAYRQRVRWLGYLGYFYIFGILAAVILLIGGVVWLMVFSGRGSSIGVKVILVLGILAFAIVRSLFVKIEPPEGLLVSRTDAPQLYAAVDAIADRLKAPRPDEIRLNEELNAAAVQTPRLGVFGWYKNTLLLGMPLLLSLTPDEARAVIAHEFGHFSGAHGKFGAWAYRLNRTWEQLRENMAQQGHANWMFGPFFNWFAPRFAATSFALRRANEYEADEAAASVAGKENAARVLMRLPHLGEHLQKVFWDPFYEQSKSTAQIPQNAFARMGEAALVEDRPMIFKHLSRELELKTDYHDTHPSLADRLRSLGVSVEDVEAQVEELAKPVQPNAAQVLFGPALPKVLATLEAGFAQRVGPAWQAAHQEYRAKSARLEELESLVEKDEEQTVEHALLVYKLRETSAAIPTLRAAYEKHPDSALLCFVLGEALLENLDPQTPELLERAAQLDPEFRDAVRERLAIYHYRVGSEEQATALREEAYDESVREDVDRRTAMELTLKDPLQAHDLEESEIAALRESLSKVERLEVAYLVKRGLPSGRHCYYLMAYHRKKTLESDSEPQKLVERIAEQVENLPPRTLIFSLPPRKKWVNRLDEIAGSLVFRA